MEEEFENYSINTYCPGDLNKEVYFTSYTALTKCLSGSVTMEFDSKIIEIHAGMNYIVPYGIFLRILNYSDDAKFIIVRFTSRYIIDYCPFLSNQIFDIITSVPPDMYSEDDKNLGNLIFEQFIALQRSEDFSFHNVVAANLFTNYVLNLYESVRKRVESNTEQVSNHIESLLGKFWRLCKEEHTSQRKVEYYASKLNISPRYLHRISKAAFGITPKQVIDHCVLSSAKKMLITSALTAQEIAFELSFPDQATFGQFFKRNVGLSPLQFRHKQH